MHHVIFYTSPGLRLFNIIVDFDKYCFSVPSEKHVRLFPTQNRILTRTACLQARPSVRSFTLLAVTQNENILLSCEWPRLRALKCFTHNQYAQTDTVQLLRTTERVQRTRREDIATILHSLYESISFSALPTWIYIPVSFSDIWLKTFLTFWNRI